MFGTIRFVAFHLIVFLLLHISKAAVVKIKSGQLKKKCIFYESNSELAKTNPFESAKIKKNSSRGPA